MPLPGFGVGNSSAGSSIAGFGSTATTLSVGMNFLPLPSTQAVQDAPLMQATSTNPGSPALDLVYDNKLTLQGMDSIDQQVLLAIATIKGTAVDFNVGSDLLSIRTINPSNIQALVQTEVEDALATLISTNNIVLTDVSVSIDPQVNSRLSISITYVNNHLNVQRTLSI